METPSSLKNISRSQASAKSHTTKKVDSVSRFTLSELTSNSPIIGVAMSSLPEKTPKKSAPVKNIPGSGESLLRGQVKASKWKQELKEEVELLENKVAAEESTFAPTPFNAWFQELKEEVVLAENNVPAEEPERRQQLREESRVAPTSAKPSHIFMASLELNKKKEPIKILDPVVPEQPLKIQEEFLINRALLFDSPDKSELTEKTSLVSSTLSYQDSDSEEKVEEEADEEEEEEEYEDVEGYNDESIDDVCAGLGKMTVQEKKVELPEFEGKHTRFVYNSDGEIEREELIVCDKVVSPSAVVLKGLPVPEGKHLRFHEEGEEEDD